MYNPVGMMKKDKKGVLRMRRVHGHMQCSDKNYSVRYNRDINAAINILALFRYLYEHGELPFAFRRSTKPTELDCPASTRYKYKHVARKAPRYSRYTASS